MTRRTVLLVLGGVAGGAAAIVVGALAGDALAGDAERGPMGLVRFEDPVPAPVLDPVAMGDAPPTDQDLHAAGVGPGLWGPPFASLLEVEASALADAVADGEGDESDGGSDAGGGDEVLDPTERARPPGDERAPFRRLLPGLDLSRFVDVCVDGAGLGCPEGAGALIFGHHEDPVAPEAPPLDLEMYIDPDSTRPQNGPCTTTRTRLSVPLALRLTNPADTTLSLTLVHHRGPQEPTVIEVDAHDAGEAEIDAWRDRAGGGAVVLPVATATDGVDYCLDIELPDPEEVYRAEAVSTDQFGQVVEDSTFLQAYDDRERPPTQVVPDEDTGLDIVVPGRTEDGQASFALPVAQDSTDGPSCQEAEATHIRSRSETWQLEEVDRSLHRAAQAPTRTVLDPEDLSADDYPYDPEWDERIHYSYQLKEGTRYRLCVWFLTAPARSFDVYNVEAREEFEVVTPAKANVGVRAIEYKLYERLPGGQSLMFETVGLPAFACQGGGVFEQVEGEVQPGTYDLGDRSLCPSTGVAFPDSFGVHTQTFFLDRGGRRRELSRNVHTVPINNSLRCTEPATCAVPRTEWYAAPIWDATRVRCDVVPRGTEGCIGHDYAERLGHVLFRVDYTQSNGGGLFDEWIVGPPGTFEAAAPRPPEGHPRIDNSRLFLEPVAGDPHALRLRFEADRPVRASVRLSARSTVTDACLARGEPEVSDAGLVARHDLRITNLCAAIEYVAEIGLVDEEGRQSEVGWPVRDASATTEGYDLLLEARVEIIDADATSDEPLHAFNHGVITTHPAAATYLIQLEKACAPDGRIFDMPIRGTNATGQPVGYGEEILFDLETALVRGPDCASPQPSFAGASLVSFTRLRGSIETARILAGESATFTRTARPPGSHTSVRVTFTRR